MSLVTRGLGKKLTSGTIATLVSFGLGLTVITPADITPPGVIEPSASFLLDGPIVSVVDHLRPHELRQNTAIDIIVTGDSYMELHPVITTDFITADTSQPHTYNLSSIIDVPTFKIDITEKKDNYQDEIIEAENDAFMLGDSFMDLELPETMLRTYQHKNNVDITFIGTSIMTGTDLQKRIIEDEEFIIF